MYLCMYSLLRYIGVIALSIEILGGSHIESHIIMSSCYHDLDIAVQRCVKALHSLLSALKEMVISVTIHCM